MTENFLRCSPDVERDDDFERNLQTLLDQMKQHMRGSLKAQRIGLVMRAAHAKGHGLARVFVADRN